MIPFSDKIIFIIIIKFYFLFLLGLRLTESDRSSSVFSSINFVCFCRHDPTADRFVSES